MVLEGVGGAPVPHQHLQEGLAKDARPESGDLLFLQDWQLGIKGSAVRPSCHPPSASICTLTTKLNPDYQLSYEVKEILQ